MQTNHQSSRSDSLSPPTPDHRLSAVALLGWLLAACSASGIPEESAPDTGSAQQGVAQGDPAALAGPGAVTTSPGTGWSATGSLASDRLLHTATRLSDGRVLVVGGYEPSAELYDPATGTWSKTADAPGNYRRATATLLASGKVLVAGAPGSGVSAALYDPATGTWAATGGLGQPRFHHTATLLPNGRVLVAGGADSESGGTTLASAELYDPATGAWTPAGSLSAGRREHAAALLPSGKVLVAGGRDGARLSSAELYDPATNTWASAGAMATARASYTATALASGKVLVAGGGADGAAAATAELYDPATGSWSAADGMNAPRRRHTATLLRSGQVLVAGGYDNTIGIHTSAELYDPRRDAWYAVAPMAVDRYEHTATLLANGRVLVAGGFSNGDQASAERYAASFMKVVLDEGPGWQLMSVSGADVTDDAKPFDADVYAIHGALGVANAPLPAGFRAQLAAQAAVEETIHYLDKKIIDELHVAEELGALTPALEAIAEPPVSAAPLGAGLFAAGLAGGACPARTHGVGPTLSMDANFEKTFNLEDGAFKASLKTTADLKASARATVSATLTFSHFRVFGHDVCIPTGVHGPQFQATTKATLALGATLNGTVKDKWKFDIVKPHLGVVMFVIPGINLPVVISFDLPITAGIDVEASATATASVELAAQQKAEIDLNITCTLRGCRSSSEESSFVPLDVAPPKITGSLNLRIQPKVWAQVALRADLYRSGTYLQLGVRPHLDGDLWGYAGNTCGTADANGALETVEALTFGLDLGVDLVGELGAPLTKSEELKLASFGPWNLGFWDLYPGGSSALRPILTGPGTVNQHDTHAYELKMRPCWPYEKEIDYELDWDANLVGDPVEKVTASPKTTLTRPHAWETEGSKIVKATAVRDAHGRKLNATSTRSIQVMPQALPGAQYVVQSVTSSMETGKTYAVSVTMRNNGVAWSPGVYFLGAQSPAGNTTWGLDRVVLPHAVAPGETVTFTFNVIAPSTAGGYVFQWQMLQDGVGSFGQSSLAVPVTVTAPMPDPEPDPGVCNQQLCVERCESRGCEGGICSIDDDRCVCLKCD